MGRTLLEKILGESLGRRVHVGDVVVVGVDAVLLQDGTAPTVLERLEALGFDPSAGRGAPATLYIDHDAPPSSAERAQRLEASRARARTLCIPVSEAGNGISHQCLVEDVAGPGQVIVGADSHTCTAGALGAVALGLGSTDVACAVALGEVWLEVPPSIHVEMVGELAPGVTARDLMFTLIARIGWTGANDACLEFGGSALAEMSQESRFVLANLAAEASAPLALMPTDDVTQEYLSRHDRPGAFRVVEPDTGARYDRRLKMDLEQQEPMVALPGRHDETKTVASVTGEVLDQVVIGSCTNGRLSDLAAAARILRGRRVHPRTRLLVVPASRRVLRDALRTGIAQDLVDAGSVLMPPGCGPCVGIHQGVLGEGQVCLATQSRNYPGRMGHPEARIYLASPLTAAASAVRGEITDPREMLDGG